MKDLTRFENLLYKDLTIHRISEVQELVKFKHFNDIVLLHKQKKIVFGFIYNENILTLFGSKIEKILDNIALFSPFIMGVISVYLSIKSSNYILLIGIILAFSGLLLSSLSSKNNGANIFGILMVATIVLGCYFYKEKFNVSFLLLSFGIPNFLLTANRVMTMMILEKVILKSEIIFIYYFLRKEVSIKFKNGEIIHFQS